MTKLSKEAQAIIKPEWDKMQDFIKETDDNMTKHTDGPWNVSKIGNNYDQYMIYAEDDQAGCNIATGINGEANAYLIAAAPDMLEALKECVTQEGACCFARDSKEYMKRRLNAITEMAEAAINKAKGV